MKRLTTRKGPEEDPITTKHSSPFATHLQEKVVKIQKSYFESTTKFVNIRYQVEQITFRRTNDYNYLLRNHKTVDCLIIVVWSHQNSTLPGKYNGYLPLGDRGRRRSKFVLYKRNEPNGVKKSKDYLVQSPQNSRAILDTNQHSISYTLSRNQAVIVEYKEDAETDMFQ
uniref:Pellino FHA domain-containing protein n=1 Tax=Megaselia scalaris TaxID=36166 RepID=T1GC53_MEGSC